MKQALGGKFDLFRRWVLFVCESAFPSSCYFSVLNFCPTFWYSVTSQFRVLLHKFAHHYSSILDRCSGGSPSMFYFFFPPSHPSVLFAFFPPHLLLGRCAHGAADPRGTLSTAYSNRLVIYWTAVAKRAFHVPVRVTCLPVGVETCLCRGSVLTIDQCCGASWLDAAVTLYLDMLSTHIPPEGGKR